MSDTSAFMRTVLLTYPATGMAYTGDPTKAMDTDTDGSGVVFQVTEDCELTHGNIICTAVAGTSPYYKFEVWPMATTGNGVPDTTGTVLAESADFQCTADLMKVAFTSSYSATQGQILCLLMVYADDGSTIDGSNYATVEQTNGRWSYWTGTQVYLNKSTSTWGNNGTYFPAMVVTTDKAYDLGGAMNYGASGLTTSTPGDIFAQKFVMPADKLLELHVIGFRFAGDMIGGSDVVDVGAWDASGDPLIDLCTIDADQGGGQSNQFGFYLGESEVYFAEALTMVSGGTYYIGAECVSGTFGLQLLGMGADFDAMQRGYPGAGWCRASMWDGSSWDDDWSSPSTPGRFMVSPILSDMHGVAGGGGSSIPGPSVGVIG